MSIKIDVNKCVGCNKCLEICPGSLIYKNESNKAFIKYDKDCWGCTACLKECKFKAIKYYLGTDIGGNGAELYVEEVKDTLNWHITDKCGRDVIISTNRKQSNKY